MLVRCVSNRYADLPRTSALYAEECGDARLMIQEGREYVVYGVAGMDSEIMYSILSDKYSQFPEWYPSILFTIIDSRLPTCWRYASRSSGTTHLTKFILTFPEWADDTLFNCRLIDGDPKYQDIWDHYRVAIERES